MELVKEVTEHAVSATRIGLNYRFVRLAFPGRRTAFAVTTDVELLDVAVAVIGIATTDMTMQAKEFRVMRGRAHV